MKNKNIPNPKASLLSDLPSIKSADEQANKPIGEQPDKHTAVTKNSWRPLKHFTDARIGLGRSGVSVPTEHWLEFQLAHAQAIDAVHSKLDTQCLFDKITTFASRFTELVTGQVTEQITETKQVTKQRITLADTPLMLHSQAVDRPHYLQRPDFGRLLNPTSATLLEHHRASSAEHYHLAIAVVDGLSSRAIMENALPFLEAFFTELSGHCSGSENDSNWSVAPICLVEQGRVAIGDEICQRLKADCVLVLIGERPGLSSPNSLGLYLTWGSKVGYTDAYRNCISNIRLAGLSYQEAAYKTCYLLNKARSLKLSGVKLKDRSDNQTAIEAAIDIEPVQANVLISS